MKYAVKINWCWGLQEEKVFRTREEREAFLESRDEDIDYCTQYTKSVRTFEKTSPIYCPDRTMSDYEMDVLL